LPIGVRAPATMTGCGMVPSLLVNVHLIPNDGG
jgi:hypothetical protein